MEKTDPTPPLVICDAGPLIHLDELGCLDLLAEFKSIIVPDAVCAEVERHRPAALSHPQISLRRINATQPVSREFSALTQVFALHAGEWEALRLALEFPKSIFLTDDAAARLAAGNLGIKAHGTIGILIRAIRRKQRTTDKILEILHSLPERSTLHIKRSLLESVISQVRDAKM